MIHFDGLWRAQGLPRSPFAEPRGGLHSALVLFLEVLRLALGAAAVALIFKLLFFEEDQ